MISITDEQLQFYNENGFLKVSGLFDPAMVQEMYREAHGITERASSAGQNIDATWGSARSLTASPAKSTVILNCHDAQFHSAVFSRLIVDPAFTGVASALMGTPNVQLHHTKIFIKPPEKGSPFPMHQDYHYFPHRDHSMIAAIVHLDDAPEEKGCLRVYPGTHKNGPMDQSSDGGWHLPEDEYPLEGATVIPAKAGDVIFFSYLTVHGSDINQSNEARTTILVQMRDPEDPPTVDTHQSRGQGMMLRGINPNASPFMPQQ